MIEGMFRKVLALGREQGRQERAQVDDAWYSFAARPTCPPSTSIHVHGGVCREATSVWAIYKAGRTSDLAWTVPSLTRDLASDDEAIMDMGFWVSSLTVKVYTGLSWTYSGWYRGGILLLLLPDVEDQPAAADWRLRLHCYPEEYATPGEAEERLVAWLASSTDVSFAYDPSGNYWPLPMVYAGLGSTYVYQDTGMPLCGVILRNDGTTGAGRYFLPIDACNRGRSYTWPRDMRPQWVNT